MRTRASLGSRSRRLLVAAALSVASTTGCATLRATLRSYDVGPNGIARPQHRLREALVGGDFVRALAWHEEDELLDRLTRATAAYYAGQFDRAGALLDTAALLSDDRVTERLSRDALALVTNDLARPYRPGRTERLFIPYYGMLAYARIDDWENAAVEARRLLVLIAQYDEGREESERALHATLAHLAGAVLERAGRGDEGRVAYRAAHRTAEVAPESTVAPGPDEGELLVVLERGFVAHRTTEKIDIFIGTDDTLTSEMARARGTDPRHDRDDDADSWIVIAFPALRASARPWGTVVQVDVDGTTRPTTRIAGVVDDAAGADERRDRLAMLARATARAGAKYALSKAAKDKKGETAGRLAGYGASLLERADLRSWHLIPQTVELLRTRVPSGSRVVRLRLTDAGSARAVELGRVVVRAGMPTILPYRIWRDDHAPSTTPSIATR